MGLETKSKKMVLVTALGVNVSDILIFRICHDCVYGGVEEYVDTA